MKVIFVSNYFNHHQKPFCEEMYRRLGTDFRFISTSKMSEKRKKLGYAQYISLPYVVFAYEGTKERNEAIDLINNADIVISGAAPNDMLLERIRKNKVLLRYSERPFKKKIFFLKKIYHAINFRKNNLWKKNIYLLSSSGYAYMDYMSIGMYKEGTYKWGYFPQTKRYENLENVNVIEKKQKNLILWCGRFIDWKHPDDALQVALRLKEDGLEFKMNFIGTGDMEQQLEQMICENDLDDCVHILGAMSPEIVRGHMEKAGIYLFTSDRQEGWGAVLNESMNSGCAVVASHEIGATPYLINNNQNGMVYKSGDIDMLYQKVKYLLEHPEEQDRMGVAAYHTIVEEWNAEVAAERFINLAEHILSGEKFPDLYQTGPCSKAEFVKDNWLE